MHKISPLDPVHVYTTTPDPSAGCPECEAYHKCVKENNIDEGLAGLGYTLMGIEHVLGFVGINNPLLKQISGNIYLRKYQLTNT